MRERAALTAADQPAPLFPLVPVWLLVPCGCWSSCAGFTAIPGVPALAAGPALPAVAGGGGVNERCWDSVDAGSHARLADQGLPYGPGSPDDGFAGFDRGLREGPCW